MNIKNRIVPAKPRSKELLNRITSGVGIYSSGRGGTSSEGDINSHTHHNKSILDSITAEMLENTLREMLGVDNTEEATDENYFSALRTLKEILNNNEVLKDLYLSKITDDTAQGFIEFLKGISVEELATFSDGLTSEGLATFLKGITSNGVSKLQDTEFGDFQSGMLTGKGGKIDKDGVAELESLTLRSFLETPEFRKNRVTLIGDKFVVGSGGIIEKVIPTGTEGNFNIKLKLEDGDINPFDVEDIIEGIYHHETGFGTTWISVNSLNNEWMNVSMRPNTANQTFFPPVPMMHIAHRGNFSKLDRQSSIILSGREGKIVMYDNVNNWDAGRVASHWGKKQGLEFLENFEYLPIGDNDAVQYLHTLLYQNLIKIDYKGDVIKEYRDRGAWSLATAQNDPYIFSDKIEDEVWYEAEKFRVKTNGTKAIPTRGSDDWTLILSIKDDIDAEIQLAKAIPYQAGEYKPNTDYIRTSNSYPIVSYGPTGGPFLYYALIGDDGKNKQPNLKENEDIWENITSFKQVFTEVLFAEFAKLDSFVFNNGKMFSQEGTLNGVAGSNEYTDDDHEPNFEVDGRSGKVKMKDADIEGTITGSLFTSKDGKVVIDGISNQIVLKDADSDDVRTVLSPRKLPLTPSSYFGSSSPTNVTLGSLQKTYSKNYSSVNLITIPSGDSSAYQITIPRMTINVNVDHPGGGGGIGEQALPNLADLKVGIYKGGILQYDVSSVWTMSIGGLDSQTLISELKSYTIQGSGTWSVRVTHTHTINKLPSSSMGNVMGIDGNAIVAKVVNSSAIGSNGMIIATSGTEYTYMVGDTYEVRRSNVGFRITSSGVQKSTNMNAFYPTWNNI